jgi:hypothetical protein
MFMSSQSGRGNLSSRKHGIGGYRSHNSPGYAQSVRDMNKALAEGRSRRKRLHPAMYATVREALSRR